MENKQSRIIKYDLICGFKYNRIKYIIALIFPILCCILLMSTASNFTYETFSGTLSYMDYLVYIFKGARVIDLSSGSLDIPVIFIGIQILIGSMVGYYPFDDIYGYGKQVFIRVGKKGNWWISKCIWIFVTVITFYGLLYICVLIFSALSGATMGFEYHPELFMRLEQIFIEFVDKTDMMLYVFVMPILYSLMISFVQVTLSMVINPIISFLLVMIYDIACVLVMHKGLLASYTMIARDNMASGSFVTPVEGIVYMIVPMVISVVIGYVVINRKEIFEK